MQAFHFRLQALLKYRIMQKEQAQAELFDAAALLRRETDKLQAIEQNWRDNICQLREIRETNATNMLELFKLYELYFDKLKRDIVKQKALIETAKLEHSRCLAALAEALKKEKVVEKFKEKKYQQYQQECLAEEQKELDEIGLQIYVRDK